MLFRSILTMQALCPRKLQRLQAVMQAAIRASRETTRIVCGLFFFFATSQRAIASYCEGCNASISVRSSLDFSRSVDKKLRWRTQLDRHSRGRRNQKEEATANTSTSHVKARADVGGANDGNSNSAFRSTLNAQSPHSSEEEESSSNEDETVVCSRTTSTPPAYLAKCSRLICNRRRMHR